ncbi:MAG: carbohydrate-binding domain-containing protein [Prevotella sp.]|nr:carbohydrate-binding domain-containing protein [Prevotella sp.]
MPAFSKSVIIFAVTALVLCAVSCSTNDDSNYDLSGSDVGNINAGGSMSTDLTSSEELFNFDVALNDDYLSETDDYNASDEDFIENTTFATTLPIVFSDGAVSYGTLPDGVSATVSGADIIIDATTSENIVYQLSGTSSDGMFKLYSDRKCAVNLSGLTLTNADGPALNIQTKKRVFIAIADNSSNTLSDGTTYADTGDEDTKGVIFSEGQLVFSGGGRLNINANCKAGISSDQYLRFRRGNVIDVNAVSGNAVRGKDSLLVSGGVLNISVSGSGNKGMKSDGPIAINGGRTTIIDTADAYYDTDDAETKGPAGINADSDFRITGGQLYIKATGKGGKGVTTDGDMSLGGGIIRVITTGTKYTYGSSASRAPMPNQGGGGFLGGSSSSSDNNKSPKGIRAEGTMNITGGDIMSRTTGGDGSEAVEGKGVMNITGGSVGAYAYDDAVNSGEAMTLAGGDVLAVSTRNDGLDSNGNMYIKDGVITTFGLGEDGVDVIEGGTLSITGGTLFSLGNTYMNSPSASASTQPYFAGMVSSLASGAAVTLTDKSSGNTLFNYTMPFSVSRAYLLMSLPSLVKGNTYTLTIGSSSQTINL